MTAATLQERARRHLWMHFTPMGTYGPGNDIPMIARGSGCHVWDADGRRYLDGLSALFCVNIGHGRRDIAQAGADQAADLGYYTNWCFAHPRAVELAEQVAQLAPDGLDRVFFTSGGSEAVEAAIKLCRQFHKLNGKANKTKVVAREIAYHGASLGALTATGIPGMREPFEPLTPGGVHVPNTNMYRLPEGTTGAELAETIRDRILFEGPDTVAAVILEPVQNAGGCLVAPEGYFARVREICDELDVLLISDEVICSWGRLGTWFGAQRLGYRPDLITTAKGLTSAYAPMGAVIASDRVAAPFLEGDTTFLHGVTFGGHPMACAIALANIAALRDEGVLEHVRAHEDMFRARLEALRDLPIVGDVRGVGYFQAIELVRDQRTKATFSAAECDRLLRDHLSPELYRRGLICRADDRGDPVIQLAPPLIAGEEELDEIAAVLRPALESAYLSRA